MSFVKKTKNMVTNEMTIKEAILKVLEKQKCSLTYKAVYEEIIKNNYYYFKTAKTPTDTIAAQLGDFIRNNDTRVKRIKGKRGYEYFSSIYESQIEIEEIIKGAPSTQKSKILKTYLEKDLHKLLSSYLKNDKTFSKTIHHEKSNNKDSHQKWLHPDMIGIKFLDLQNKNSQALMKVVDKSNSFELTSYEIKKEINSDYELKKCYFQAVSNSSWANFGYLVAFEINKTLKDEIERLNQSFGIGVIELKANPYESTELFPSKYRELDFNTIDKICIINKDFETFIEQTEKLLTASNKYLKGTKKEFEEFCDDYFIKDSDIDKYCIEKNIPLSNAPINKKIM